ncbi:hypothetical protein [Staphylococcus aureus]|uniref:hypothetical protein n=1 Tax=Staphylococcus aureus TaxID=1280 RepID=UPI0004F3A071|nr:hypothetical protein [Staphylococcus aureus]MCR0868878.1 hypothetical protein [Staphylococcus aureus]MCS5351906.1 hypothetical protein [Staphylococcus aureus]
MSKKLVASTLIVTAMLLNTGSLAFANSKKLNEDIFIKGTNLNSQQLEKIDIDEGYKEFSITTNDVTK